MYPSFLAKMGALTSNNPSQQEKETFAIIEVYSYQVQVL
jgi:hypothetical protein